LLRLAAQAACTKLRFSQRLPGSRFRQDHFGHVTVYDRHRLQALELEPSWKVRRSLSIAAEWKEGSEGPATA
jgi:hypothetical protein